MVIGDDEMKVGIVGAGNVGSTLAYTLSMGAQVSKIVLVDKNVDKAHGEILDLRHGLHFIPYVSLDYGGLDALDDMDVIVVTAGKPRQPGETRLDLARKNTELFSNLMPEISEVNQDALYLIVANPVDVLTYAALKYSVAEKTQVFGSGNVLDSARFQSMLGEYLEVDPANVHAYILGEHGETAFPVWSQAFIGCTPIKNVSGFQMSEGNRIYDKVKSVASEVIAKKGATYYAVSLGVAKIINAVDLNQNRVLPLTTLLEDYHGVSDVCLSVPSVVNHEGVDRLLKIPFNNKEEKLFNESARKIGSVLDKLGLRDE